MKERPILFSAPMVRALLEGRKSQTRRMLNPQPTGPFLGIVQRERPQWWFSHPHGPEGQAKIASREWRCPYGEPGDLLWVKETWKPHSTFAHLKPSEVPDSKVFYAADNSYAPSNTKWWPSLFMQRRFSRIVLRVTDVRVERLNQIGEADALAEGIVWSTEWRGYVAPGVDHPNKDFPVLSRATAREMYAALWDTINGSGEWLADPWVWAVSFERI